MRRPKKDAYVVAVVGATGAVGREMVSVLEDRDFPLGELRLYDSERSEGETLGFRGRQHRVRLLKKDVFAEVDMALFAAGEECSRDVAPAAVEQGCVVIDTSSWWRMDLEVPLVVPEVNPDELDRHGGIIANPSGATIQMVMVLKPIHDAVGIERVVATIFQSVSGSGRKAMEELLRQTTDILNMREIKKEVYPHQIAFGCLPHVGAFRTDGYTREEANAIEETRRIMGDENFRITATAVQVPVFRCHSESLNIETRRKISPEETRAILSQAPGVVVFDAPEKDVYPLPVDVAGSYETFVGRVRSDLSVENGIALWVVADNLLKGSALNAVQIAEGLVNRAA